MHQVKKTIAGMAAVILFTLASPAMAAKVVCQFNPTTGKLEPTLAWKNTLGAEADAACAQAMPPMKNNAASGMPAQAGAAQQPAMPAARIAQLSPVGAPQSQGALPSMPPQQAGMPPAQVFTPQTHLVMPQQRVGMPPPAANAPNPMLMPKPPTENALAAMPNTMAIPPKKANTIVEATWRVELKDITLSTTFSRWADVAGWKLRWDADKNVLIDAPDSFSGTFEDAVASVLSSDGIRRGTYPLEVCFYTNTPPLARITRKGEQKDCK
jgi:hypothetical protein